jgi:hypothetical protein
VRIGISYVPAVNFYFEGNLEQGQFGATRMNDWQVDHPSLQDLARLRTLRKWLEEGELRQSEGALFAKGS